MYPQLISMEGEDDIYTGDFPDYYGNGDVVEGITTGLKAVGDIFGGAKKRKAARKARAQAKGSALIRRLMAKIEAKQRGEAIPEMEPIPSAAPGAHIIRQVMERARERRALEPYAPMVREKPLLERPEVLLPLGIGAAVLVMMLAKGK